MKHVSVILFFALLLSSAVAFGQVPQGFSYQAVVRDASGAQLANKSVMVLVSVTNGDGGNAEYQELHKVVTNQFGLVVLSVGHGAVLKGSFEAITWATGNKYLEVAVDVNGGQNYEIVGSMELLSVPYALYSGNGAGASEDTSSTNELITGTLFDPATGLFSITEAGTVHSTPIDVKQDDLSDNSLNDLSDVDVNPNGGDVLRWNGTKWVGNDGSDFYQQLAIINNILTITGGNAIDLSSFMDNTDAQQLTFDPGTHMLTLTNGGHVDLTDLYNAASPTFNTGLYYDSLTRELTVTDNGTAFTVDLSHLAHDGDYDATNELQTISKTGNVVSLSHGGGTFVDAVDDADSDPYNEIQVLGKMGRYVTLSSGGGGFWDEVDDADADSTNELQTITKVGNVVSLSHGGGSFVDAVDDADADATNELNTGIYFDPADGKLTVTDAGGGITADLSYLLTDLDASNELQTITKTGNVVTLSQGGGSFTDAVEDADADPTNELQTVTKTGNVVTLSMGGGSFTDEVNDADSDPTNELQTLSLSNDTLFLSDGGSVKLPTGSAAANINGNNNYLIKFTPNGTTGGNSQVYDSGNFVGVGTNLPGAKLQVSAAPNQAVFKAEQNGSTKMVIDATGKIGLVNNPNPSYLLDAMGYHTNVLFRAQNTSNNGTGISASGNNITGMVATQGSGLAATGYSVGVAGFATNSSNSAYGGYFWNDNVYAYVGGWTLSGGIFTPYKIIGNGAVSTIVDGVNGDKLTMFAPEAPEVLFQDYGVAELVNGKAVINLDPNFSNNIEVSADHPLKVFIQLEGDCNGVFVSNKTAQGFEVKELAGGASSVSFSYMVVATRKSTDIELPDGTTRKAHFDVRFPAAPKMMESEKLDKTEK